MPDGVSEIDFPYDELNPERPLIYISLGTVFNENPSFFQSCIEAFGKSDYQAVISLGNRLSPASLGDIPENFIVRAYVPQIEILKRTDLFITHGGVNSLHQALYYGIPLLFFPQQVEQAVVAARIAKLGAGYLARKASSATLRSKSALLLGDKSYQHQAGALGESLRAAGGVKKAADAIIALETGD